MKKSVLFLLIALMAILLVFGVMASTYESFKAPLINLATMPFIIIGVILIHKIIGEALSFMTAVGVIMLIGIVVNNGIILVDYINQIRRQRRLEIAMQKGTQDRDGEWSVVLSDEEEDSLPEFNGSIFKPSFFDKFNFHRNKIIPHCRIFNEWCNFFQYLMPV